MTRTEDEKNRRHLHGGKGAKFSHSKQLQPRQDGCSNTLTGVQKDNLLHIRQPTAQGYVTCPPGGAFDAAYPGSPYRRGRVQDGGAVTGTIATTNEICIYEGMETLSCAIRTRTYAGKPAALEVGDTTANAITSVQKDSMIMTPQQEPRYRIRKLTPRECFRLMDVDDADIDKIQQATIQTKTVTKPAVSKSQQYKLAGNSIVVSCLYHIFRKMFIDNQPTQSHQLSLDFDL